MAGLVDDLRGHPVRGALHGLEDLGLAHTEVDTQSLGTAKVNQLDDPVRHQHHVTSLDVPVKGNNLILSTHKAVIYAK